MSFEKIVHISPEEIESLVDPDAIYDTQVRGWIKYWKDKLITERAILSPGINQCLVTLENGRKLSPEEHKLFAKFVNNRVAEIRKSTGYVPIDTVNDIDLLQGEIQAEKKRSNYVFDIKLPESDLEQDQEDLKHDTSSRKWIEYWRVRLSKETEALPANITEILDVESPTEAQIKMISEYVVKRLKMLQFRVERRVISDNLRRELRNIDERKDVEVDEQIQQRTVFFDEETGSMFVENDSVKTGITAGDIVADIEWGLSYRPDPKTLPPETWRRLRKQILVAETRSKLERVRDRELAALYKISLSSTSISVDNIVRSIDRPGAAGVIAERMMQTWLKRIQIDRPDIGLKVEHSNAIEDAELKYDFKVTLATHNRGVAIKDNEDSRESYKNEKRKIGIQFTVSQNDGTLDYKLLQIEGARSLLRQNKYADVLKRPVDDIVLVSIPIGQYVECLKLWLENGKPSGGPEKYLSPEVKKSLIVKVTEGVMSLDELTINSLANDAIN